MGIWILSPAKINLTLEVLGRRPDGFHELETIMQELRLADELYLDDLPGGKIELECDHPLLPVDGGNLAYRAAACFQEKYAPGKGVRITLKKRIPLAAGLGGGSSNAAAVLKGLRTVWGVPLEEKQLMEMAATLGSDVSFFLRGGTALATGRGEKINPLPPFPRVKVLLVSPANFFLSAGEVYGALDLHKLVRKNKTGDFIRLLERGKPINLFSALPDLLTNDLEQAVFPLAQNVLLLKNKLRDLGFTALLSGSGPTVFALSPGVGRFREAGRDLAKSGFDVILTETKGPSWG
ncbi:MAG TPA: 4-(cytidine 5'-diphospho)-2-C-methyl-D-erythritol kinase [Firmicutes bacterium]|jgi:4-diphosphocytidyl-2-C-methyl-D-erythritol kinase|nr:4-(cytidine 5'-diphospho)-2-C-methyl-D-erythritol kinase [Bacillota bacterium]